MEIEEKDVVPNTAQPPRYTITEHSDEIKQSDNKIKANKYSTNKHIIKKHTTRLGWIIKYLEKLYYYKDTATLTKSDVYSNKPKNFVVIRTW